MELYGRRGLLSWRWGEYHPKLTPIRSEVAGNIPTFEVIVRCKAPTGMQWMDFLKPTQLALPSSLLVAADGNLLVVTVTNVPPRGDRDFCQCAGRALSAWDTVTYGLENRSKSGLSVFHAHTSVGVKNNILHFCGRLCWTRFYPANRIQIWTWAHSVLLSHTYIHGR